MNQKGPRERHDIKFAFDILDKFLKFELFPCSFSRQLFLLSTGLYFCIA